MKIISGGQVGADIAGLRAAKRLGFETGGWMPRGFRTLGGPRPQYAEMYGLKESSDSGYPKRTRLNVMMSHGTLRFAYDWNSRGEILTRKICEELKRPYYDVNMSEHFKGSVDEMIIAGWNFITDRYTIKQWRIDNDIYILNIAGNANTMIEQAVENFLVSEFSLS